MKLALLFPGQGSQKVEMGSALARDFEPARRVFEEADDALGFAISRLCFEGPEEQLRLTINTQPAILTVSVAALRVFEADCGVMPEVAAGHSLGEYGALVAAGALHFSDAVRAVRERGRLMQEACPPGQGAMAALIGLDLQTVAALCDEASSAHEIAVPANLNSPDQIVISGMMPALEGMAPILGRIRFHPMRFGVIANVTAEMNRDADSVLKLLLQQITRPVRWEESMRKLVAAGVTAAVEFGAGNVLAGLMRRIDRSVRVYPSEDTAALRGTMEAIAPGT